MTRSRLTTITALGLLLLAGSVWAQQRRPVYKEYFYQGDYITDPEGRECEYYEGHRFCLEYYKGGAWEPPDGDRHALVVTAIEHDENPNPLPVLPKSWRETCDRVIVVVDLTTCEVAGMVNVDPVRPGVPLANLADGDSVLYVQYTGHPSTLFYPGPPFGGLPATVLPYSIHLLSDLDARRLLVYGLGAGDARGRYIVLERAGRGAFQETGVRVIPEHWGFELNASEYANLEEWPECAEWRSVFADDGGFVALFPKCKNVREHARVAAYPFSGGAPAVITLPDGYEDLHVERVSGVLRCSWSVGGERTTREFVFPDTSFPDLDWWYEPYPEPTYWLDERGVLRRLADGAVCDYAIKPDGTRYDFLPYGRKMHLWASPDGRYVVVKGALNPKDNPNPGPCDRPGFFRKGYDSVLMVVDTQSCRPVRIFNVTGDTPDVIARFTADGELLLVSGIGPRTTVLKLPSFKRIGEAGSSVPRFYDRISDFGPTRGPAGKRSLYWWRAGLPPDSNPWTVISVQGDRLAEVPEAEAAWKAVEEKFTAHTDTPYWVRPRYIDDELAVFVGVNEDDPEAPVLLATAAYASGAPKLEAEFVKGARDVTIRRRPDGSVVCDYATAKGRAEKVLWKPPEKAEHGQEPQAPGH